MSGQVPTLEINLGEITKQYNTLHRELPDFRVFYAVKANPEQKVLETLKQAGSSFEIASIGELKRLQKIGVDPRDVIFSNPVKIPAHIEDAYAAGIRFYAFDCKEELEKIAELAPESNVYLRLNVSNVGSQIKLSSKFGCNKSDAAELLALAREKGLKPYGISFHVGSQAEKLEPWEKAINDVADIMNQLIKKDTQLKAINIGGGFPVEYSAQIPKESQIARIVHEAIQNLPYKTEFWCEPGRYLVASSGTIHAHVIGKTNRGGESWLFLDTGRFQSFIELFESEDIRYPVSCENKYTRKMPFTLTGPTCDSYDTIMHNVLLPKDIKIGDTISFGMCGAYTHVYGAPFNDFPVPVVRYNKT